MSSLSLPGHSLSIHAAPAAGGNAAIAHTSPAVWLSADRGLGTTGARQFVAANKLHMLRTTNIDPGTQDFWFGGWVNVAAYTSGDVIFYTGATADGADGFLFCLDSASRFRLFFNDSVQATRLEKTFVKTYTASKWHYVIVICNRTSGIATLYVDGAADSSTLNISAHSGSLGQSIGGAFGAYTSGAYPFQGCLDKWCYGQGALPTQAEITALYNQGNGLYGAEVETSYPDLWAKVTHCWNMNESTPSSNMIDCKGTNHFTPVGAELLSNTTFATRTGRTWANLVATDKGHLECADNAALDLADGDFVLTASVKRTTTGEQVIMSKWEDDNNYWTLKFNASHYVQFIAKAGGNYIIDMISSTTACSDISTVKYHIAVLVDRSDASKCHIYVNGADQVFSLSPNAPEMVTNGAFAADTDWTKGTNWEIDSGVATKVVTPASSITQFIPTARPGAMYWSQYTLTRTAGSIKITHGGTDTGQWKGASGTYSRSAAWSGGTILYLYADVDFAGTVDNVSLKQHVLVSAADISNAGKIYIGQLGDGTLYLNGYVAQVGIGKGIDVNADAVRTAAGTTLYNSGLGQYYTEIATADRTTLGLTAYWDLSQREYDSAGAVTATDSTAGANHLTMVGAELVTDGGFAAITYGDTLLTNGGFETAGAGDPDFFGSWTEDAGNGAIANEAVIVNAGGSTVSAKLTAGATKVTHLRQETAVASIVPGQRYRLRINSYANDGTAGRYAIYDSIGSAYIANVSALSNTAASWAEQDIEFVAPTGCTRVRIYLYCPNTDTHIVYFDDVSVSLMTFTSWTQSTADTWRVGTDTPSRVATKVASGVVGSLFQNCYLTIGNSYDMVYTLSDRTVGGVTILAGGSCTVDYETTNATHSRTATCAGNGQVYFYCNAYPTFDGSVDNVSVKAASIRCVSDADVFGSWVENSGDGGKSSVETLTGDNGLCYRADVFGASGSYGLASQGVLTVGHEYHTTGRYKTSAVTASVYHGSGSITPLSASGAWADFDMTKTATTNTTFSLLGSGNSAGSAWFDSISCKCTGPIPCAGPREATAADSVGGFHGVLTGMDVVGAWSSDVPTGFAPDTYALTMDGVDDYLACGNVGNVTAIELQIKFLVDDQEICTLANSTATAVTCAGGTLTFGASLTASAITVDGVAKSAAEAGALLNDNGWHKLAFALTSVAASNLRIGTDSSAYGNFRVCEIKINTGTTAYWKCDDGPQGGEPSDGDPVATWEGKNAARHVFSQSTASARPTHELASSHGKPSLVFDGSSDFLTMASAILSGNAGHMFIVAKQTNAGEDVLYAQSDTATTTKFLSVGMVSGLLQCEENNAGVEDDLRGDTACGTTWHVFEVSSSGSATAMKVDGTAQTVTPSAGSNSGHWFNDPAGQDNTTIGAMTTTATAEFFDGEIAEIVAYDSALSDSNALQVRKILASKYGITLA